MFVMAGLIAAATPAFAQFNAFKDPVQGSSSGAASGPDLKAAEPTVQGGQITVGATAYVVARFKNPGTSPVNVTGINLYPSSTVTAKVNLNKCAEAPLPPEAECAITVEVTGIQAGAWRVEVLVDHDGRTRLATAALTGQIDSSNKPQDDVVKADLEAVPAALDFGSVTGGVAVKSVLLRNRTQDPLTIKNIAMDVPEQMGFTYKPVCPQSLQPGEACSVIVTWSPLTKGDAQGLLNVSHSARSSLTQVEVKGRFDPVKFESAEIYPESVPDKGILVSDKEEIDFGSGIKGASAITLSLVNVGTADLTLKSIKLSGSDSGVSIARSGCRSGTVLKPVEACALTVNWVPSREGDILDDLQVHHTGARGILLLPVRGGADGAVSRETLAVRQPNALGIGAASSSSSASSGGAAASSRGEDIDMDAFEFDDSASVAITPSLDGYVVTSHSPTRAVINGPVGSLVVRDGEDVVISGVKWTVTIVSTGVIVTSAHDEILLIFDKSLKPLQTSTSSSSSGGGSSSSGSSSSSDDNDRSSSRSSSSSSSSSSRSSRSNN